MTDTVANNVATPSTAQHKMVQKARMVRTLCGGTEAMRHAREKYLPKEQAESEGAYHARLHRSVLFGATAKTVQDMTGKVFEMPIAMEDDVPPQLKDFAENIDLTGRHLTVFGRDVFADVMQPGVGYIYVDMPPALPAGSTLAQEQAASIRPYLTYIPLERLIGWKSTLVAGAEKLTQIRIKECVSVPNGDYLEKDVDQIRVVELDAAGVCTWQTFRASTDKINEWVPFDRGNISLSYIPLVPVYLNRTEFMCGSPPLEKLAELNIRHWQSSSDQTNILHVARVPVLFGSGFGDEARIEVGASTMIRTTDANAKLVYVEHSGRAIDSGQADIDKLEYQMQQMGLQLLVPKPGGQSATGAIIDTTKENSPLAMMAHGLRDALEQAFGYMADFIGIKGGEDKAGGSLIVNTDFSATANRTDLQQLLAVRQAGDLSQETLWVEMQRRDYLSDSFDPDVEKERIASEPVLGGGPPMDLGTVPGAKPGAVTPPAPAPKPGPPNPQYDEPA